MTADDRFYLVMVLAVLSGTWIVLGLAAWILERVERHRHREHELIHGTHNWECAVCHQTRPETRLRWDRTRIGYVCADRDCARRAA
jgi:hypothetical protein